jgi:hypothetical protein
VRRADRRDRVVSAVFVEVVRRDVVAAVLPDGITAASGNPSTSTNDKGAQT